jgi:hypothetical protein
MKQHILLPLLLSSSLHAAITIQLPGQSESAAWANLRSSQYPGAGGSSSFTNSTAAWPAPIAGNMGSLSSTLFSKVSGGGYFAGSSVYDAGVAGLFALTDASPISDLKTLILQIDAGTRIGVSPLLNFNGGSQALSADYFLSTNGSYTANGPNGPVPTTNRAWQWDLSAMPAITSYEILWGSTTNNHLTQHQINVTAGDTFAQVVPEPSASTLGALACTLFLLRRKK